MPPPHTHASPCLCSMLPEKSWAGVKKASFGALPPILRDLIAGSYRHNVSERCWHQGLTKIDPQDSAAAVVEAVEAIEALVAAARKRSNPQGAAPWFLQGEHPTELDAVVMAVGDAVGMEDYNGVDPEDNVLRVRRPKEETQASAHFTRSSLPSAVCHATTGATGRVHQAPSAGILPCGARSHSGGWRCGCPPKAAPSIQDQSTVGKPGHSCLGAGNKSTQITR